MKKQKNDSAKSAKKRARSAASELKEVKYSKKINSQNKDSLKKEKIKDTNYDPVSSYEAKKNKINKLYESKLKSAKTNEKREIIKAKHKLALMKLEVAKTNKLNNSRKGRLNISNSKTDTLIGVRNISKAFTNKTSVFKALDDVSLEIKKGEFVVIVGPSGSGKTTLLNTISGLDRPTSGEIIIKGTNLAALSNSGLTSFRRENIGFVFQSYNLLSTLNVRDNIELGRSLQTDKHKRMNVDKIFSDIDLPSSTGKKKTYELSGGQQQRISIARAISKAPDILIGDEPTGALDTKSKGDVFSLFQEINKKNGTTIIIVTHDLKIAKLANRVIHVKDSKIDKIVINKKPMQAKSVLALDE